MSYELVMNLVAVLLHSLWQGLLIMVLLAAMLKMVGRISNLRYGLCIFAMLAVVLAATVTYSIVGDKSDPQYSNQSYQQYMMDNPERTASPQIAEISARDTEHDDHQSHGIVSHKTESLKLTAKQNGIRINWQYIVVYCWITGVAGMLLRMLVMLSGSRSLVKGALPVESDVVNRVFRQLVCVGKFSRRIAIAISEDIVSPCIVGVLRPVILLPTCITGLSVEEITAVLSHELAHIRRLDWLVNIFQMLIEALLFFNPAIWWISRQIRLEREWACDRYAVQTLDSGRDYAELLMKFAAKAVATKPAVALSFSGQKKSPLAERVKLLLVPGYKPFIKTGLLPILAAAILGTVVVAVVHKGTDKTIEYIGKDLTIEQRQEIVDKAVNNSSMAKLAEEDYITLKGKVVTEDGGELPYYLCNSCDVKHPAISMKIEYNNFQSGIIMDINDDGSFEKKLVGTRGWIIFMPDNNNEYALKCIPFNFEPGQIVEDFQVVLERGVTREVLIVDENNIPIPGARVTGGYPTPPRYGSWRHSINSEADENGIATLEHCNVELKANLKVTADGYEIAEMRPVTFIPGVATTIIMKKVPLTTVLITDAATGEPVQGARVLLDDSQQYYVIGKYGYSKTDDIRKSGLDGIVKLFSISPDNECLGLVKAEGYQRQYFEVIPGKENHIELGPQKPIKGKITGNLNLLPSDEKGKYIWYTQSHYYNNGKNTDSADRLFIDERDGIGYFEIEDYYGQEVSFSGGPIVEKNIVIESQPPLCEYNLGEPSDLENIVIALPEGDVKQTVKVKLRMVDTAGELLDGLNGRIICRYVRGKSYDDFHKDDIINGIVEFEAKSYSGISCMPDRETGYYFERVWYSSGKVTDDIEKEVICFPAGSIIGTIKDFAGNEKAMLVDVKVVEESPELARFGLKNLNYGSLNGTGYGSYTGFDFIYAPLPLGGTYYIYLSSNNTVWRSANIKLTQRDSVCKLDIKLPELVDVKGRIVDDLGKPLIGIDYCLCVKGENINHYFGEQTTGPNGEFELKGINPEILDCEYYVRIQEIKGYCKQQDLKLPSGKRNLEKFQKLTLRTL